MYIWHKIMLLFLYCISYVQHILGKRRTWCIWACVRWLIGHCTKWTVFSLSLYHTDIKLLKFDFSVTTLKTTNRAMIYWIWLIVFVVVLLPILCILMAEWAKWSPKVQGQNERQKPIRFGWNLNQTSVISHDISFDHEVRYTEHMSESLLK